MAQRPDLPASSGIADLLSSEAFSLTPSRTSHEGWTTKQRAGFALGVVAFALIGLATTPDGLSREGQMAAAAFSIALVWWVTEPLPTHVTSLVLMLLLVVTKAWDSTHVLGVFGLDVIWLNILAFVLSAMLVRTHLAKRLALALIERFGRRATTALGVFVLLQLVLAPLIPATAARAAITLPLMLAVGAVYGSTAEHPTNFGRNMLLLNLTAISVLSSTVMTGSAANLMAVGYIQTLGGHRVFYTDWLIAAAPIAALTVMSAWLLGPRVILPIKPEDRTPRADVSFGAVKEAHAQLGKLSSREWRAIIIFAVVIALWATDRFHQRWFGVELSAPMAAMIGVILALSPKIGVLEWGETDIPWHLLIFSAGAYAGGLALDDTGAGAWAVERIFGRFNLQNIAFGWTYAVVTAVMLYSHLLSTSKTVRTVIMIPLIIMTARGLGWDPVSLALPAAFTIDWVIGLPISGKPNVILFGSQQYTAGQNLRYGLAVCTIGYLLLLAAGATYFKWIGLTPGFGALPTDIIPSR